jgi:hypothetical protein
MQTMPQASCPHRDAGDFAASEWTVSDFAVIRFSVPGAFFVPEGIFVRQELTVVKLSRELIA